MLKATAGGGGMGLQICDSPSEITAAFQSVTDRGASLFNNTAMFMEKYVAKSRHVEVQVFGNGLGFAVHFGERECSIQRRHQKVVEECPSPFVHSRPGELLRYRAHFRHERESHRMRGSPGEQRGLWQRGYR
jgi:urea carboxylase